MVWSQDNNTQNLSRASHRLGKGSTTDMNSQSSWNRAVLTCPSLALNSLFNASRLLAYSSPASAFLYLALQAYLSSQVLWILSVEWRTIPSIDKGLLCEPSLAKLAASSEDHRLLWQCSPPKQRPKSFFFSTVSTHRAVLHRQPVRQKSHPA